MKLKYLLAATTAALCLSFGTAHAVEVADDPSVIVITATKRETNLKDTPISVVVQNAQSLQDRHVQSLVDFADGAVPSLRVATFESRQSALTIGIRGIVPFDANQTARDQGVGVYLDGVYLGRQQGLNAALFDVDRIEVLRGPQGTLFGRNTEGGALSIITKQPTGEFGGSLTGGIGNYGSYTTQAHIDLPSVANIAVKVDGVVQHQDATVKNILAGQTGWNYRHNVGGKITAKWEPTDNFSATVSYDNVHDKNTPNYSQLINYNPTNKTVGKYDTVTNKLVAPTAPTGTSTVCATCIAPLSRLVYVSGTDRQSVAEIGVPQQPSIGDSNGYSANLKYTVSPTLELRSITAKRRVTTEQWDNSGGAHRTIFAPNANFSRYSLSHLYQDQVSQEFQAVGELPKLDYVVGLYYFKEHVQEYAATASTNKWNATGTAYTINSPSVAGAITSSNNGWNPYSWFFARNSRATSESKAAFAQATWTPVEKVHLTVGGRYTEDKRNGALTVVSGVATPWKLKFDKSRFDPMVTVAVDATDHINAYAKYSTGYRAGGANDRSSRFSAFGPESVTAYEIGTKANMFDNTVNLNVAGYMMDRTGTQIDFDHVDTSPYLADGVTKNPTFNLHTEDTANAPGTSKIRGAEVELTVRPTNRLSFGTSYAYTYTNIPATLNPQTGALTKVFVVYTPKNAAAAYVDYRIPLKNDARVELHADANYSDAVYSFQNENVLTQPSFIVNGRVALANLSVANQKTSVSLWGRNILDETHVYRRSDANITTLGSYANFNPPRTFGVEVNTKF
jgi:iron complex outermembrane receptor protein